MHGVELTLRVTGADSVSECRALLARLRAADGVTARAWTVARSAPVRSRRAPFARPAGCTR